MDEKFWHTKKSKQFLKNIDTFYYAIYFENDFLSSSKEPAVFHLRQFCADLKQETDSKDLYFGHDKYHVLYLPGAFSIYSIRLSKPEYFDLFIAPVTSTADTPQAVLQLRSRPLWEDGVYCAFEESFNFVKMLAQRFSLTIREVKENRCDFACHSNYLSDPEKFFDRDHFVKMWVGSVGRNDKEKVRHFTQHITVYDGDITETDYVAIGKRGDKCFIRIYLKSKEVIQEGYKGFFLQLWYLSGLISRYDLYCLEEAYKRKSWNYLDIARLLWALENDDRLSTEDIADIRSVLDVEKVDINKCHKLAKKYTPSVTKIFNIEFQCMRDMSKSFELIPKNEGVTARVYDYLDNYELIYEYLTRVSMRLVRTNDPDPNKSRRDNNEFWDRLRNAKTVDFKRKHKDLKLIRKYTSNVNLEIRKKRAISSLSSYGYAMTQEESGSIFNDASQLLSTLNDNDFAYFDKHKKKLASRNAEDIPDEQKRYRSICYFYDPETDKFYD